MTKGGGKGCSGLQREEGVQIRHKAKAVCGAECFPKDLSLLEQYEIIPGSGQGFSSSVINFREWFALLSSTSFSRK